MTIQKLVESGVKPGRVIFINLITCPEGLEALGKEYPDVRIVTGVVDSHLNDKKYIIPGLGDLGDRYFGTIPRNNL